MVWREYKLGRYTESIGTRLFPLMTITVIDWFIDWSICGLEEDPDHHSTGHHHREWDWDFATKVTNNTFLYDMGKKCRVSSRTSNSDSSNSESCIFLSSSCWSSLVFSVSNSGFSCCMVKARSYSQANTLFVLSWHCSAEVLRLTKVMSDLLLMNGKQKSRNHLSLQARPCGGKVDLRNHGNSIRGDERSRITCCQEESEVLVVINNLVTNLYNVSWACVHAHANVRCQKRKK